MLRELWFFLKARRKWWLLPVIFTLLLFGAALAVAQGSALAPFLYAVF